MKPSRICLASSEVAPLAKTGGLADVAAGLSRYLGSVGHDVRVFMPLYKRIREGDWELTPSPELQDIQVALGGRDYTCQVSTTPLPSPTPSQTPSQGPSQAPSRGPSQAPSQAPGGAAEQEGVFVYLVDCPQLFDRDDIYSEDGDDYLRFGLFSRAILEACQRMQWGPDVFHCNDWHTGLLPLYLRTSYAWDQLFRDSKTLLTIHNIGYQGTYEASIVEELELMDQRRHLSQEDLDAGFVNFLKTGLLHADALTTVSRTYAREIQTGEFGMGLEEVLQQRRNVLHGIVNGVDYGDWNPATDPLIQHNYSAEDLSGKARNKEALLTGFELPHDARVPVIGVVSRFTGQKGFDLLPDILPVLLQNHDLRLVVLGSGESDIESYFQWLRDTYPQKVAVYRGYNNELAHQIEAGADLFLMPSRYEPCGLNQMYSLRYGTPPIVRRTGGLADTVQPFDPASGQGTGFVFEQFESQALYQAIRQALSVWKMPTAWAQMIQNGMAQDFSWQKQGQEYEKLYESLRGVN